MRKPEFGSYCFLSCLLGFYCLAFFFSLVCFKTFDKHAKIWNKWKSFIRSSIVIFLKVWFS